MQHALPFTDEKNTNLRQMLLDVLLQWPRVLTLLILTAFISLSSIFSLGSRPSLHITGETVLRTRQVQFDNYSLILNGQRVFLQYATDSSLVTFSSKLTTFLAHFSSGEFHTFRLPVPSLWPDILQKAKAAGLNALSIYTHMGIMNPSPGVVDFEGFRALEPLYDAAKEAGVFLVIRPGTLSPSFIPISSHIICRSCQYFPESSFFPR